MNLLNIDKNKKTIKGQKHGYMTGILYLAPATESGVLNTCPYSSPGCRKACLYTAGHGRYQRVKDARIRKTVYFYTHKPDFMADLIVDIRTLRRRAIKNNMTPVVRLNGTSDIEWEDIYFWLSDNDVVSLAPKDSTRSKNIFDIFPDIQFYDYTKNYLRFSKRLPNNYHLTFSQHENNKDESNNLLASGVSVAIVVDKKPQDTSDCVDGDLHDLRFLDPAGSLVFLTAKGKARHDKTGFVERQQKELKL